MDRCGDLVPKFLGPGIPLDERDIGECLLKEGHADEHLVKTVRGYYLWRPQEDYCRDDDGKICDCDFRECYVYQHISKKQARRILARNGAGTD